MIHSSAAFFIPTIQSPKLPSLPPFFKYQIKLHITMEWYLLLFVRSIVNCYLQANN